MKRALRRVAVALAGALLASAGLAAGSGAMTERVTATERPAQAGACTSTSGITVVVDFGAAGGGVQTRCAPGPVRNGFEALVKAGFEITNVHSQPGFLCQIEAVPESDCTRVPSASRYWSYWHAGRGQPWTYSTSGGSRKPPAGSVDGWAFGAGSPPVVAAPAPIGPATTTTTTTRPTTAPPPPASTTPGASTTLDPPSSTTSTVAGVAPAGPGGSTSTTRGSDVDEVAATNDGDDEGPSTELTAARRADEGAGSPAGPIAAALLVLGVGAVGVRTARRRARQADGAG